MPHEYSCDRQRTRALLNRNHIFALRVHAATPTDAFETARTALSPLSCRLLPTIFQAPFLPLRCHLLRVMRIRRVVRSRTVTTSRRALARHRMAWR